MHLRVSREIFIALAALICLWGPGNACLHAQLPKKPMAPPPTLDERLWKAVDEDDVKAVADLALQGANVNARRASDGSTPLIACVKADKMGMAAQLLKSRADPNLLSEDAVKNSALLFALEKRKEAVPWVELLLQNGANPDLMPGTKNYTPLMKAVAMNEPEIVEMLVQAGADIMIKDPQGGTALSRAIGGNNIRIIKLLNAETQKHVVRELKPMKLSARDRSLLVALEAGREEEALTLLADPETNPNARNAAGYTALMLAVDRALPRAAQRLIDLGANIHAVSRDAQPRQVIFFALGKPERVPLMKMLLDMGAEPNAKRPGDNCPILLEAVRTGPIGAIEALLKDGARPADRDAKGRTARELALAGSDQPLIALFRNYASNSIDPAAVMSDAPASLAAADLSAADLARLAGGDALPTPTEQGEPLLGGRPGVKRGKHRLELHLAIAQEDLAKVRELLADGADPNSYDRRGRTPLMSAADVTNPELCKLLMAHGADVSLISRDEFQAPAIIYAASRKQSLDTLKVLLEGGSPVDARLADWQFTPLILAASLQSRENVQLLLAFKANVRLRDKEGHTALDLAKKTGNEEIVSILETAMTSVR